MCFADMVGSQAGDSSAAPTQCGGTMVADTKPDISSYCSVVYVILKHGCHSNFPRIFMFAETANPGAADPLILVLHHIPSGLW